ICDDSKELNEQVQLSSQGSQATVFTKETLDLIYHLLTLCTQQIQNLELILNNIRDGLIVVNEQEQIQYMNQAASKIIDVDRMKAHDVLIKDVIQNTRLPKVLQNQKKEVNQKLQLANQRMIVTTRIPLINEQNHLIGAFAIFMDSNEVLRLAEENTYSYNYNFINKRTISYNWFFCYF